MDINLQMRSVDLMVKFLKHDLKDVPSYGYALQKQPALPAPVLEPLPRSTPERMGMSSAAMERLFRELSAQPASLGLHACMVLRHGHVIAEGYWSPYKADVPNMLFSMSKSVVGTAVGIAIDEGVLTLDERVVDVFSDIVTPAMQKQHKTLTVRHLLTMSSGNRFNEVGSVLDDSWLRMFLESVPKFEPGSAFEYNSLNTYVLAAILRRKTGLTLTEYLAPRLYAPLGITRYDWEVCPQSVEKGGWGLSLTLEDCAKLGQLYLNKGEWKGKRIVSREWVEMATAKQIETPNGESKDGYGFQIWMNGRDAYQFNGAFGQYVIVLPALDAVVTIFSGSPQLFAEGSIMELLRASFWVAEDAPLQDDPVLRERLCAYTASLHFAPVLPAGFSEASDPAVYHKILGLLDGREYRLESNTGGLFPQSLQAVHGNFTLGMDMVRFFREGDALCMDLYEGYQRNTLRAMPDYMPGRAYLRGEEQLVGARLFWKLEEDGDIRLFVVACFIETPFTRMIQFDISGNAIRLTFHESPTVAESTNMLLQLIGYSPTAYIKRMAAATKRIPGMSEETITDTILHLTLPVAEGGLIEAQ
ncbi:MAG: serine hydrolase [Clostridia bacterium]|nr:serine hydrolase [Clostridia bacterium]